MSSVGDCVYNASATPPNRLVITWTHAIAQHIAEIVTDFDELHNKDTNAQQ